MVDRRGLKRQCGMGAGAGVGLGRYTSDTVHVNRVVRLTPLVVLVGLSALLGCRQQESPVQAKQSLRIARYGASFALSALLAEDFRRAMPDLDIQLTDDLLPSARVVEMLERGDVDIGLAQADVAYFSTARARADAHGIPTRLRAIAMLPGSWAQHLVVRPGLKIRSVAELRGHSVRTGGTGTGALAGDTRNTATLVLKAFGLDRDSIRARALPAIEAVEELNSGRLDALFAAGAFPSEILAVAMRAGAQLVPIEGAAIDDLVARYPFMHVLTMPSGTYDHQPTPYRTIGIDVMLLCRAGLDDQLVHRITAQFFKTVPRIAQKEPYLRLMNSDDAASTPVPLHEGAARYYREEQLFR